MSRQKIKTAAELVVLRAQIDAGGGRLVFTNGCFDLLHAGHVRYLQAARALGAALVVAVNGDESVRALKGDGRPINSEDDRAEVLSALGCVDFVTTFHADRVTALVREVRPHIYVKGGDYTAETLNAEEVSALREAGSDIRILPLVPGKSTTETIRKLESGKQESGKREEAKA